MDNHEQFSFYLPTRLQFGLGQMSELAGELRTLDAKSLLVVTSPGAPKRYQQELGELVSELGATIFSKVGPNPTLAAIDDYRSKLQGKHFDSILGFGGGSVMDTARVLSVALDQETTTQEILDRPADFLPRRKKLILVPSTSGTASEVTPWSTVWDDVGKKKLSLSDPSLYADLALIDPAVMIHLSPRQTAITGMDTLSHCLETLWSKASRPLTELFAKEALELTLLYLPQAVEQPDNLEAREAMAKACLLAGMAFSQTRTAAAHSISYPLTLLHDVPHGIACSITLPALMTENARADSGRMFKIAQLFGAHSARQASEVLTSFMKSIGIPTRLSEIGLRAQDLPAIVERSVTRGRMDNNLRVYSPAEVQGILESLL